MTSPETECGDRSPLVELQLQRKAVWNAHGEHPTTHLKQALPYYLNYQSGYIHRVRSGLVHWDDYGRKLRHVSIGFWCGGTGFPYSPKKERKRGELIAEVPEGAILCASCHGRAIGAGLDGERVINGTEVIYRPRPPLNVGK